MRTKFIPAYEPESSTTTRLTPEDTAKFLAKFTPEQISEVNKHLNKELLFYGSQHKNKFLTAIGYNDNSDQSILEYFNVNDADIEKMIKASEEKE